MIPREFDKINGADIEGLVASAIAEGRNIEYKQQLPGNSDEDKREFLADVSSMANAAGGDLIYGIIEKRDEKGKSTGLPEKADGLTAINADTETRRLDEIIRSGIDPRIPGFRIRSIDGFSSGPVIVVRVPKSWALPHMVTFKNLSRFYSRTSAGKYQLDVSEIRSAFAASGDLRARITGFRSERLGKIVANEAPVPLPASPKVILHLVPLSISDPTVQFELQQLANDPNLIVPIQPQPYNNRYNVDGFLSFGISGTTSATYCQLFRTGVIEAVDADLIEQSNAVNLIASTSVEEIVINAMIKYLETMKKIGVLPPVIIMVTALGVKGFAMATSSQRHNMNPKHKIDRDTLVLPDVLLESYDTPTDVVLKPIFDALWQASGFPGCHHYDANGRWTKSSDF